MSRNRSALLSVESVDADLSDHVGVVDEEIAQMVFRPNVPRSPTSPSSGIAFT